MLSFALFLKQHFSVILKLKIYKKGEKNDDVYILAEYRHQGYGLMLLKEVVEQAADGESIFLSLLYDSLSRFYEKAGFEWAFGKEYIMVRKASGIA